MLVQSGRHAGKTAEEIILKSPDWAEWLIDKHPQNNLVSEFKRLIQIFDAKPFVKSCWGCGEPATRASAYRQTADDLYFWCDQCDPYSTGANRGKLTSVRSFRSALDHVNYTCAGRRIDKRVIVRELAVGKGLPARVGAKEAVAFFK